MGNCYSITDTSPNYGSSAVSDKEDVKLSEGGIKEELKNLKVPILKLPPAIKVERIDDQKSPFDKVSEFESYPNLKLEATHYDDAIDLEKRIKYLTTKIADSPNDIHLLNQRAIAYLKLAMFEKALEDSNLSQDNFLKGHALLGLQKFD